MADFIPRLSKEERPKDIKFKQLPEGFKPGKQLFCPLCGEINTWVQDNRRNVKVCPNCGLSTEEFWVKTVNHLWGNIKGNKTKDN